MALAALGLDREMSIPDGPLVAAAPLLRIGAVVLRATPRWRSPVGTAPRSVLAEAGFTFAHPDIDSALDEILG